MDQQFYREYAEIEDTHLVVSRGRRAIFDRVLRPFEHRADFASSTSASAPGRC